MGLKGAPLGPELPPLGPRAPCAPHPPRPRGVQPRAPAGLGLRPGAGAPWARRLLPGPAGPQGARVTPFLRLLTREGRMELQKGLRTCVRARGSWTALLVREPSRNAPGTPGETGRRVGGTRASA